MRLFTGCLVLAVLACTGEAADTGSEDDDPFGNTGGSDTDTERDDDDSFEQTEACEAYLDCIAAVDAGAYDEAADRYGAAGSCWDDDADEAEACDEACDDLLNALADDYPEEDACNGKPSDTGNPDDTGGGTDTGGGSDTGGGTDTGGEDTGSSGSPGCALDNGAWEFLVDNVSDGCDLAGMIGVLEADVTCTSESRGEFVMDTEITTGFPMTLACVSDGRDFECAGAISDFGITITLALLGTANSAGTTATGEFVLELPDYSCASIGTFEASK